MSVLYRKALCITTKGDWRRGREERGILKCSVVFNASNKKKKSLFYETARYLAELTLQKENFNKLLGSRKLVREINQKNCKNCNKKLRKMYKLFQICSPFISYCKEEPA